MEKEYQIITAESYAELKKDTNEFFPGLSDNFLWHFWNEIERFANEEENLFDKYHRAANGSLTTTIADITLFSEHSSLWYLYSDKFREYAFAHVLNQLIYAVLPVKEAFVVIYMPKDDKFSEREYEYIDSCLNNIRS